jgi:hypothetical protein
MPPLTLLLFFFSLSHDYDVVEYCHNDTVVHYNPSKQKQSCFSALDNPPSSGSSSHNRPVRTNVHSLHWAICSAFRIVFQAVILQPAPSRVANAVNWLDRSRAGKDHWAVQPAGMSARAWPLYSSRDWGLTCVLPSAQQEKTRISTATPFAGDRSLGKHILMR